MRRHHLRVYPAPCPSGGFGACDAPLLPIFPAHQLSTFPSVNANKGHYYGSNLSDADKNALIEYLKTL
jgi:hypothetical protein